jgi:type II secretory ATPase GspE/PulE/Tfp pilus assembly ATPase PilB-like protein
MESENSESFERKLIPEKTDSSFEDSGFNPDWQQEQAMASVIEVSEEADEIKVYKELEDLEYKLLTGCDRKNENQEEEFLGSCLNISTLKKSPYLTLKELIDKIDDEPLIPLKPFQTPEEKKKVMKERDSFISDLRRKDMMPLFFNRDDSARYLTMAVRAHTSDNGKCERDPNDLIINLEDYVVPYLKRQLKDSNIERSKIEFLLLSDKDFDNLYNCMKDSELMRIFRKKFSEETEASKIFYSMMAFIDESEASDAHIESKNDREATIRYRIDGKLYVSPHSLGTDKAKVLCGFIKRKAEMLDAHPKKPQDGAIIFNRTKYQLEVAKKDTPGNEEERMLRKSIEESAEYDKFYQNYTLRIATLPTPYGQDMAIRVERIGKNYSIDKLGFPELLIKKFRAEMEAPHGLFLITGPTGSGKTTTIYSLLSLLNTPDVKIISIEDPIEQRLQGITQTQVTEAVGYDFSSFLRHYLRFDPDYLFVGEMRDRDTFQLACQAALTGHGVFSTLHTNDAASAIERIKSFELEDFVTASSLRAVFAQRLIRKLCSQCKEQYNAKEELSNLCGLSIKKDIFAYAPHVYDSKKNHFCRNCRGTGYHGRTGIGEFLKIGGEAKNLILNKRYDAESHFKIAVKNGMTPLISSGINHFLAGETSLQELRDILGNDDFIKRAEYVDKAIEEYKK